MFKDTYNRYPILQYSWSVLYCYFLQIIETSIKPLSMKCLYTTGLDMWVSCILAIYNILQSDHQNENQ